MNFNRILSNSHVRTQIYPLSTKFNRRNVCKISVSVESELAEKFENEELKHRHHPGIVKTGCLAVPQNICKAIHRAIGDFPLKTLVKDGKVLSQYICSRHPPPEVKDIQNSIQKITAELEKKYPMPNEAELGDEKFERKKYALEQKVKSTLKERTFAWKPITYGPYEALVYAIGRSAREYAVLTSIFKEIQSRQSDFKPRSFFDFGSGVGTAIWAASNLWKECLFEYLNVDSSREMNDLADLILRDGNENQQKTLRNVYYRQFLPSIDTKYDIVVSAFTLFELGSAKDRREVILNLWKKCNGYLVIAEEGSRRGFQIINEVRSIIVTLKDADQKGHVFAPCPHDFRCPRLASETDSTPCNFEVSYEPLGLGEKNTGQRTARYSYVVLRKGTRQEASDSWPRLVRPTLVRSKHTVCRMCTSKGTLQEIVFTKSKHGRDAYRCARSSEWGDRLPIEIGEEYETKRARPGKCEDVKLETDA